MRKIYRRSKPNANKKRARINQQINAPKVQLINELGEFLGPTPTSEALRLAKENGFELVEINPTANPPIAKIIDYGKFKYEQEKKQKKQKLQQKKVGIKGMRLSFRIGQHDLDIRKKQTIKHLSQGDKLKIEMTLRGRENQHVGLARKTLENFIASVGAEIPVKIDEPIKKMGAKFFTIISSAK
jgi:translation initiation factor IF-3